MHGINRLKAIRAGQVGRKVLFVGSASAVVGLSLLASGTADAAVGTQSGLTLTPASGATSTNPTYNSPACPAGFQGSAVINVVNADGSVASFSQANNAVASPFSGNLFGSLAQLQSFSNIANGGTQELVVFCYSQASEEGTSEPVFDDWLTYSSDGSSYTTSATAPSIPTSTTTLTVSPGQAQTGQNVTFTANVTDSDGSSPSGTVSFETEPDGTVIGSPVTVTNGTATLSEPFSTTGTFQVEAVFSPSNVGVLQGSSSSVQDVVVTPAGGYVEPLAVTVPASGSFNITVGTATVNLAVSGSTATGALNPITVTDSRNTYPGWSVSGQTSDFTETSTTPTGDIPGDDLGWAPTDTALADNAALGSAVTAGSKPGLGDTAETLASAAAGDGFGTTTLGANLTLDIPASAPAAAYTGALTVTAATSAP
ncbi:MAG TPA: Ig-like domain-containing protein [Trebonia sp.]|nr:Ig-like domain-containing protein [Trebonia sp.]